MSCLIRIVDSLDGGLSKIYKDKRINRLIRPIESNMFTLFRRTLEAPVRGLVWESLESLWHCYSYV